jgi:hypothetical protein
MMPARLALIALIIAFGISAAIAALTTIRQVHTDTSPVSQPIKRI